MLRALTIVPPLIVNLFTWGTPILLLGAFKFFVPDGRLRRRIILILADMGERWVGGNDRILDAALSTRWDIQGIEGLRADGHYLVLSNHISWVDIVVAFRALHRKVALPRFFLKQELIWFPIIGQACWALDFPFMKRYSAAYLEKHPEKRGRDLKTTRIACRRYEDIPVSILNYAEGTRFSRAKHAQQQSPYRHLLRPRVGGTAFVLASLGAQLDAMIDFTIAYPRHDVTFFELISNRVPKIVVRARRIEIPPEFLTNAITEPGPVRERFKVWIEQIWREKDELLGRMLFEARGSAPPAPPETAPG